MRRLPSALSCALLIAVAANADARTWTVGGAGADFPLIAPAIRAAADGDVIVVRRGVYREDLIVDRMVSLQGEEWPVLIGTGAGTVIEIRTSGAAVEGLIIEGSGVGLTNQMDAAVHVMGQANRIVGNVMRRVFYGVVIVDAAQNEVASNTIEGLSDLPFGRRGDGVYLFRAPDTVVRRNHITGMRDGIYFQYAPRGVAEGNIVERSRYGLHDMFSDHARIEGNTFRDSLVGATVMNSSNVSIRANRIERNRGVAAVGLSIKQCDDSTIERNVIAGNVRGTLIDGSSGNRFVANRFAFNDTAVALFSSAERNVFTENVFDENWSDVIVSGGRSDTRWSENGRGNRWSRYRGFDFDGDGIGEAPHPIAGAFEQLEGRQPATRLFLQSPAAQALDLAANLGLIAGELDPAPLGGQEDRASAGAYVVGAGMRFPGSNARLERMLIAGGFVLLALAFLLYELKREVRPCSA